MDMFPPLRKKLKKLTRDEIVYLHNHYGFDANIIINDTEEYDIPEVDNLEREIEEKFNKIEGEPLDVYKKFLNLTDQFNDLYKNYSPCKRGCGGCCKIPLQISEMEKDIIKKYLEEINEISKYVYNSIPPNPIIQYGIIGGNYKGKICPFLEDNECKIYLFRPYNCRRYISLDDNCSSKFENLFGKNKVTTVIHIYSEIYYQNIVEYYCRINNIKLKLNDIRDYFVKRV